MKKNSRSVRVAVIIALLIGFGLSSGESDDSAPAQEAVTEAPSESRFPSGDANSMTDSARPVSGSVSMEGGTYFFRECGENTDTRMALKGNTNLLDTLYSPESGEVFASLEIKREGGQEGESIGIVSGVNYWPFEGFNCSYPWSSFGFKAFGNEPFWVLEVTNGRAELSRPDHANQSWDDIASQSYPITSLDGSLEIKIVSGGCQDGMSGNFFGYQVALRAGQDFFKGCGMFGVGTSL